MSKNTRWLLSEVERWASEKIISVDQAARIRLLYPETGPAASWGLILFSGLGAIVAGLGIILLLAYNWDDIPKAAKLAVILGSIAAAHAGGLWLKSRSDWRSSVGDAVAIFGTMLFGAGIWLVAQIYNIDEHYPNGFLIWGMGGLGWRGRSIQPGRAS